MAEAIEFADACNRSSSGTSNVLSRSLSRNLARIAAVLGGRSVSIADNCQFGRGSEQADRWRRTALYVPSGPTTSYPLS